VQPSASACSPPHRKKRYLHCTICCRARDNKSHAKLTELPSNKRRSRDQEPCDHRNQQRKREDDANKRRQNDMLSSKSAASPPAARPDFATAPYPSGEIGGRRRGPIRQVALDPPTPQKSVCDVDITATLAPKIFL